MKKFSFKMKSLLFVALVMFFALQTSVSAADTVPIGSAGNDFTLTINAANVDDTFAVYKLINVNYSSANNNVTYSWSTAASNYIASLPSSSPYSGLSVATFQNWANDSSDIKSFLGGFAVYVKSASVSPSYTGAASSSICTINGMSMGQYMILGTGSSTGAYVYQIMTASFKPNAEYNVNTTAVVNAKASIPTIEKEVDDPQVAIDDTVTYTVTVTVPTYPADATNTTFKVWDTLPAGVTFASTSSVKSGSTTIATNAYTATGAEWVFDYDKIKAYSTITIVYTATVNDSILIGEPNTNIATLTYSNDPYGDGTYDIDDTEDIYSYGLQVFKVDSVNHNTKIGAVSFAVYKGTSATGTPFKTITTNDEGVASLAGLDVGNYTLVETKTATGYVLDDTPFTITITDEDIDGIADTPPTSAIYSPSETPGFVQTTITNTKGNYNLPQTGGIGTWVFTIIGLLVMVIAAAIMVMSAKKKRQTNN
ncbi:MAG TPA: isopeptide-forming domain-containing fimbrial protein [Clostridiales bacterium]|nr:isopeptide-forming domain-containing fimbrial protein [Clostridiales bacterium]